MRAIQLWQLVCETKDLCWTHRMKVPGGWLYRHGEVLLESVKTNPMTGKEERLLNVDVLCSRSEKTELIDVKD